MAALLQDGKGTRRDLSGNLCSTLGSGFLSACSSHPDSCFHGLDLTMWRRNSSRRPPDVHCTSLSTSLLRIRAEVTLKTLHCTIEVFCLCVAIGGLGTKYSGPFYKMKTQGFSFKREGAVTGSRMQNVLFLSLPLPHPLSLCLWVICSGCLWASGYPPL